MDKVIHYYVCGHTAAGHVNYLQSNLHEIDHIIILHHESNALKTKILHRLINDVQSKTEHVEVIHNCHSERYIDGIIFRSESIAFLSHDIVDNSIVPSQVIHLDRCLLKKEDDLLQKINNRRKKIAQHAYHYFNKALHIHDALEKIYIKKMDFEKATYHATHFIHSLFNGIEKQQKSSHTYERLFGTNTAEGMVNVVEHLIKGIKNRVYIKGRAGTGKSFFMRQVLQMCQSYRFDVEVYYCSFDPNSIDMLIIRDLDYCLFDSTSPHEFFPENENDHIIDLYDLAVEQGTDERFKNEIERVSNAYKEQFKKGLTQLSKMKEIDTIEKEQLNRLHQKEYDEIVHELLAYF